MERCTSTTCSCTSTSPRLAVGTPLARPTLTVPLTSGTVGAPSQRLVQQGYQRHLLQVGYTDAVVGRLLARLDSEGVYDASLVIVVADHGAKVVVEWNTENGERGEHRRHRSSAAIRQVARSRTGACRRSRRPDDRHRPDHCRRMSGVDLNWGFDGRSLLRSGSRATVVAVSHRDGSFVRATVAEMDRAQAAALRRKDRHFGEGRHSLFALGASRLRPAGGFDRSQHRPRIRRACTSTEKLLLAHVRKASGFAPVRITGTIEGVVVPSRSELALAVNGRIAALSGSVPVNGTQRFGALVGSRLSARDSTTSRCT